MKKVGVLLLAAGNSTRYDGIKLLDTIDGKEMYLYTFENMKGFTYPKVVVTQYKEIYEKAFEYGFTPVKNLEPNLGISHSIHLGLKKLLEMDPYLDGVLFSVCDQPYIKKKTIEQLIDTYIKSEKSLACIASSPYIIGNPCIISRIYFKELFALEGDVGGKKIIKKHPEDVELVIVEDKIELYDIDKRADKLE